MKNRWAKGSTFINTLEDILALMVPEQIWSSMIHDPWPYFEQIGKAAYEVTAPSLWRLLLPSMWIWHFSHVSRRIWFRATLFSIVGVSTALLAIVVSPFIPDGLSGRIGADAVDNILAIIASSMLTVTTFSLSTMVSAYSAATSNVTPRATRLVMEDSTTQNVLATFVGSFLFSLVGIVALSTGASGEQGRLMLFIVTVCVIILIVITLLRWIDHLSRLGRVTETTRRVEEAIIKAIRAWRQNPNLGARGPNRRRPQNVTRAGLSDRDRLRAAHRYRSNFSNR